MNDLIDIVRNDSVAVIPVGIAFILMLAVSKLAKQKGAGMGHRTKGALALIIGSLLLLSNMIILVHRHVVFLFPNACIFAIIFLGISCFMFAPNERDAPVDKRNKTVGLFVFGAFGAVIGMLHWFVLGVTEWYPALLIELCGWVGIR